MIEDIPVRGSVSIALIGPDGRLKQHHKDHNLVTTVGLYWIAGRLLDASIPDAASHIGVGTGTTAAALGDTALETPLGARQALASASVLDNVVTYTATFAAGVSTGAITEFGLFNAVSSGTMIARAIKPVINKEAGDSLAVVWTLTIGD